MRTKRLYNNSCMCASETQNPPWPFCACHNLLFIPKAVCLRQLLLSEEGNWSEDESWPENVENVNILAPAGTISFFYHMQRDTVLLLLTSNLSSSRLYVSFQKKACSHTPVSLSQSRQCFNITCQFALYRGRAEHAGSWRIWHFCHHAGHFHHVIGWDC